MNILQYAPSERLKVRSSPPHSLEVVDGYTALGSNSSDGLHATGARLASSRKANRTMQTCGARSIMLMSKSPISSAPALSCLLGSMEQRCWYSSTSVTSNQRKASIATEAIANGHSG